MKEIFEHIEGYEDEYLIYNDGRIWSNYTKRFLKPYKNNLGGYLWIQLTKDGVVSGYAVHRLIGFHFIDNPERKPCINHKDFDVTNNSLNNLEWVTWSENEQHKLKAGRRNNRSTRGEDSYRATLNNKQVRVIKHMLKERWFKIKQTEIAKFFGVKVSVIGHINTGLSWKYITI